VGISPTGGATGQATPLPLDRCEHVGGETEVAVVVQIRFPGEGSRKLLRNYLDNSELDPFYGVLLSGYRLELLNRKM
jgi:hypothetical protein